MRKTTFILPLFCLCMLCQFPSYATGPARFSQYLFQTLAINPAEAGTLKAPALSSHYRSQFNGLAGTPNAQQFTFQTPVKGKNIGLGAHISRNEYFITRQYSTFISYAYHIEGREGTLSMGMQGGFTQYHFNFPGLTLKDPDDPVFQDDFKSSLLINFGFGLKYATDNYFLGVSIPKLLFNALEKEGLNSDYLEQRELAIYGGFYLNLGPEVSLLPNAIVYVEETQPLAYLVSLRADISHQLQAGLHYRSGQKLGASIGYLVNNQLRVGYAFDMGDSNSGIQNYSNHEIAIRYFLTPLLPSKSIQNFF